MAAATAIAAVVLLLLGGLCGRSKFARSWFLTIYYCGVILVRGLSMPNDAEYRKMMAAIGKEWAAAIIKLQAITLEIEGASNIPSEPCLYLVNHQSSMDIPALVQAIPGYFSFMPKMEIRHIPLVGYVLERSGHIFLDRSNARAAMRSMNEVAAPALQSRSFLLFPEGTRSKAGIIPFKKGPFHVALAAKALVVPVALAGSDDMRAIDPTTNTIRVSFGVPMRLSGSEEVVDVLTLMRQKIISLNEASGGKGAKEGTEESHVAKSGNPTKKAGLKAWLPDA